MTPFNPIPIDDPLEAAYEQTLPELSAIPEAELLTINIDVMAAVTTVQRVWPELQAMRPEVEAHFRDFDFTQFDRIEQYARALRHAHCLYLTASSPRVSVQQLANELNAIRGTLLMDATCLAQFGLFDAEALRTCNQRPGHAPLAKDVLALTAAYKAGWSHIEGKTAQTLHRLDWARAKAIDLVTVLHLRNQAPHPQESAARVREQAFTLLMRSYESARRAVLYLRDNAEANRIAPSLYSGRGGRARRLAA